MLAYDRCVLNTGIFQCICLFREMNTCLLNPIAFRKAKIVGNLGLSVCNRVNTSCLTEVVRVNSKGNNLLL